MVITVDTDKKSKETVGFKIGEAADFLINLLAGSEMPSEEVLRLADKAGIGRRTMNRAKHIVGAKSRMRRQKWYMTVPEEMKGRTFSFVKQPGEEFLPQPDKTSSVSSDWASVVLGADGGDRHKTDIPTRVAPGGLRVKVGMYEFEADGSFPVEKLAELLRGLTDIAARSVETAEAVTDV